MKKTIYFISIALLTSFLYMQAQDFMYIYRNGVVLHEIPISQVDSVIFYKSESMTVTDCQGNVYPIVKMGEQYWMAENLQCTKYDTNSEQAGQTLLTSAIHSYAPYYIDGRNHVDDYTVELNDSERGKLGMLYNWAAAVGLTEAEALAQTTDFAEKRQGICPNGYHLPTDAEWQSLADFVGSNSAIKLKTTSAWYSGGNGIDIYGFSILPSGVAYGSTLAGIGAITFFWTSTAGSDINAYNREIDFSYTGDYRYETSKLYGQSVRCVRD